MSPALVFRRHGDGHAIVRHGPEVPELAEWTQRRNLADLFATGVLARSGVSRNRILAIAQSPELEIVFAPVWDRVKRVLARRRSLVVPGDESVFGQMRVVGVAEPVQDIEEALQRHPKETLLAVPRVLHLRPSVALCRDRGDGDDPAQFPDRVALGQLVLALDDQALALPVGARNARWQGSPAGTSSGGP